MSEDKEQQTEDPTPKRLSDARAKGQVAVSREVSTFMVLAAATTSLLVILPWSSQPLFRLMRRLLEAPDRIPIGTRSDLQSICFEVAGTAALAVAPAFALLAVAAIATGVGQTGFMWSTSKLAPKLSMLNPLSGVSRIFSFRAVIEFGKGMLKVAIVGGIGISVLSPVFDKLPLLIGLPAGAMMGVLGSTFQRMMIAILSVIGVIAAGDYFYQRWSLTRSLRMSRQELKEEHKDQEGDPHIKAHLRKIRMTRARRRMLAAVPNASVVVTNPTHFAVALRYDGASMGAPKVVAKGADFLAQRIREVATENNVPIIENPPLARTLYAKVEVDDEIPAEQYKAVAEIIGYVMRLKKGVARARR